MTTSARILLLGIVGTTGVTAGCIPDASESLLNYSATYSVSQTVDIADSGPFEEWDWLPYDDLEDFIQEQTARVAGNEIQDVEVGISSVSVSWNVLPSSDADSVSVRVIDNDSPLSSPFKLTSIPAGPGKQSVPPAILDSAPIRDLREHFAQHIEGLTTEQRGLGVSGIAHGGPFRGTMTVHVKLHLSWRRCERVPYLYFLVMAPNAPSCRVH